MPRISTLRTFPYFNNCINSNIQTIDQGKRPRDRDAVLAVVMYGWGGRRIESRERGALVGRAAASAAYSSSPLEARCVHYHPTALNTPSPSFLSVIVRLRLHLRLHMGGALRERRRREEGGRKRGVAPTVVAF